MTVMRFAGMNPLLQVIFRLSADIIFISYFFFDIFAVKIKNMKKKIDFDLICIFVLH